MRNVSRDAVNPAGLYPVDWSWFGNTYSGNGESEHLLHDIAHIYATPDGVVYTNVVWDEGGGNFTEIKDGRVTNIGKESHGWGYEGGWVVCANATYVYFAQRVSHINNAATETVRPENGRIWYGVTRRDRKDIKIGKSFKGGKGQTDSGKHFLPILEFSTTRIGNAFSHRGNERYIKGLHATENELFVSISYHKYQSDIDSSTSAADNFKLSGVISEIHVYDAETMEFKRSWKPENPMGHIIAMDKYKNDENGNLWIVEDNGSKIYCCDTNGNIQELKTITAPERCIFGALCIDKDGRMLVADRGINEQILIYENLTSVPKQTGTIGAEGGIFSGIPGEVGENRFYQISGIGADSEGNIYVANSGIYSDARINGFGGTNIECYAPSGSRKWQLLGLLFVDSAATDPKSAESVYTKMARFGMDYTKPAGRQWTYKGYTINPHKYPHDPRLIDRHNFIFDIKWIQDHKFMFVTDMYACHLSVYRFNYDTDGEIAVPCAMIAGSENRTPPNCPNERYIWIDRNGDGQMDASEYETCGQVREWGQGWDIDDNGTIWNGDAEGNILKFTLVEINEYGVPVWTFNSANYHEDTVPPPFHQEKNGLKDVKRLRYDAAEDVMYISGFIEGKSSVYERSKDAGDNFARYNNWSNPEKRSHAYVSKLAYTPGKFQGRYDNAMTGFYMSGDYLFAGEATFGVGNAIHIYSKRTGEIIDKIHYEQQFGETGLIDIPYTFMGARIAKNKNSYLIFVEDDLHGKVIMLTWHGPDSPK